MSFRVALLAALALSAGCQNRRTQVLPNRVLDRPLDAALACVRMIDGVPTPQSLDQCSDAVADSVCGDIRLLGFVANSERNDIAMFSRCAGAVIDMNVAAPGPQLISAGEVPSSMTVTTGTQAGCFAVAANLGSCDLSVLDVGGLAAYAWEDQVPDEEPGAYVSTVVPRRADRTPLGARPGQVLAVPPDLSNAATGAEACDPAYPGSVYVTFPSCQLIAEVDLRTQQILQSRQFVRDDNGNITIVDTGSDPLCPIDCSEQFVDPEYQDALASAPPGDPEGMYPLAMSLVTPPADPTGCVDEADLQVQDTSLYVGGLGSDFLYELRFDGKTWTDDPLEFEVADAQGISAIRPTPPMIIETGDPANRLFQFLYILAGDGSTRVVRRFFDPQRDELGIECDTQADPSLGIDSACHPAEFPGENPPDRRPFARGPGIRPPNSAIITDWTFQKWYSASQVMDAGGSWERCQSGAAADDPQAGSDDGRASAPFSGPGVVGVGTTSFGRIVFSAFGQFFGEDGIDANYDRLGILEARVPPHTLWPEIDPFTSPVDPAGLPRMDDKEPSRLLPGDVTEPTVTRVLSPSLRRIDRAYQVPPPVSCTKETQQTDCDSKVCQVPQGETNGTCLDLGAALSPRVDVEQGDGLEIDEDVVEEGAAASGLYKELVARAVVRDYAAWENGEWNLFWEGEIPNTTSSNGQLVCDNPGNHPKWEGATCLSTQAGDTRLVDQTAQFCDRGVLAGDKLFMVGCSDDSDCGTGQYCLLDIEATNGSTGLCVSQSVFQPGPDNQEAELLQKCRPFLHDDCGAARREYSITRAFQGELWLQVLDKPLDAYLMVVPPHLIALAEMEERELTQDEVDEVCEGLWVSDAGGKCSAAEGCGTDDNLPCCTRDYDFESDSFIECERRMTCSPNQPDNGCAQHSDCVTLTEGAGAGIFPLCIDGVCRRVCDPDPNADPDTVAHKDVDPSCSTLTPLPGPACFQELIRYQVRARNSFVVRGPGPYNFLAQRVKADPETAECYEDPTESNLLTSRIRLGRDENDTRYNALWPTPSCPADSPLPDAAAPNPCFIDTLRPDPLPQKSDDIPSLYHFFEYGAGQDKRPVPAIRYSNPMMSLVLDLTSLEELTRPIPGTEELFWWGGAADFLRSRIPGGFRESFSTRRGYNPYDRTVVTSSVSLVGPTRIISAPELSTVYIVDSSGGSAGRGTRGQVVRVTLTGGQISPDVSFLVR